jgi:hypothetical protein
LITTSVLGILKIVGLTVALISSAIAAAMDLKDHRGALTFWGRVNVGGIVFGGFLAISAQLLDNSQKQEETLASLRDIQRILHPIMQIRLGFRVRLNDNSVVSKQFLNSVWSIVHSLKDNPCTKNGFCSPAKGTMVQYYYPPPEKTPVPHAVYVDGSSSLIPSDDDSRDLTERGFDLRFYKAGGFVPDPKSEHFDWLLRDADLQLRVYAKMREERDFSLHVILDNNTQIEQVARFVNSQIVSQTGDIASILDLENANLILIGAYPDGLAPDRNGVDIKCIEIEIQTGRVIWVPRNKMKVMRTNAEFWWRGGGWFGRGPLYFVHMPENLENPSEYCMG